MSAAAPQIVAADPDLSVFVTANAGSGKTTTLVNRVARLLLKGVRPGDIELSTPDRGIPAKVVVIEPTGAETELLLEVGSEQLIVVLHGRTAVQPEERVGLVIDGSKAHLFDDDSGQRLD